MWIGRAPTTSLISDLHVSPSGPVYLHPDAPSAPCQYHGQRISHAIVMTDALNIHDGTLKLKKDFLQRRAA